MNDKQLNLWMLNSSICGCLTAQSVDANQLNLWILISSICGCQRVQSMGKTTQYADINQPNLLINTAQLLETKYLKKVLKQKKNINPCLQTSVRKYPKSKSLFIPTLLYINLRFGIYYEY